MELYPLEITVSVTPSANKLVRQVGWKVGMGYKNKYLNQLKGYDLVWKLKTKKKMKLTYIRYSPGTLDETNLRGGIKPLEDAIKEKGLIVDDSPQWAEIHHKQVKCKQGYEKTAVVIEPAAARLSSQDGGKS